MHNVQSTFMMWDPYCTCNKKNKLWALHNVQDDKKISCCRLSWCTNMCTSFWCQILKLTWLYGWFMFLEVVLHGCKYISFIMFFKSKNVWMWLQQVHWKE
jgi:hypothetical protein